MKILLPAIFCVVAGLSQAFAESAHKQVWRFSADTGEKYSCGGLETEAALKFALTQAGYHGSNTPTINWNSDRATIIAVERSGAELAFREAKVVDSRFLVLYGWKRFQPKPPVVTCSGRSCSTTIGSSDPVRYVLIVSYPKDVPSVGCGDIGEF